MSKNRGLVFQDNIRNSAKRQNIMFYKFKDSPNLYGQFKENNAIRFTPNNICDCMLFYKGTLVLAELKSTEKDSFSFTTGALRQLKDLYEISIDNNNNYRENLHCGFMIEFRDKEMTVFIYAKDIKDYLEKNNTKTININKLLKNGGLIYHKIDQEKLVKNYVYNLKRFILNIEFY